MWESKGETDWSDASEEVRLGSHGASPRKPLHISPKVKENPHCNSVAEGKALQDWMGSRASVGFPVEGGLEGGNNAYASQICSSALHAQNAQQKLTKIISSDVDGSKSVTSLDPIFSEVPDIYVLRSKKWPTWSEASCDRIKYVPVH